MPPQCPLAVGAGWETLFVAVDDHSSVGFTDLYPDERKDNAVQFLENSVAYYKSLDVKVRGLLTDNGSAFHSKAFAAACERLGLRHKFTRAYRPQTNGNAECFIQSTLREWAYGFAYNHSRERADMLARSTTTTGIGLIKESRKSHRSTGFQPHATIS
jgi:transposase InsO family protein